MKRFGWKSSRLLMHQSLLWVFFVSSDTFFLSLSRSSRCCGFFSISSWLENCSSLSKSVFAFISLYRIDSSIFTWKMAAYYITLESCSIPNLTNNSVRLDSHRLCKLLSCVYCIKWHFARPHTHTHTLARFDVYYRSIGGNGKLSAT